MGKQPCPHCAGHPHAVKAPETAHACADPACHDPHCAGHPHPHAVKAPEAARACADPACHDPHCAGHPHPHAVKAPEAARACADPACHDPHCAGHPHPHAAKAPEHASVLAVRRAFAPARPVARAALEAAAAAVLRDIGEACCLDGVLPGHAKCLLEADGAMLALSLTMADRVDAQAGGGWVERDALAAFSVTLNVHLVLPHAFSEDALFRPFGAL
ncbi:MAG: hypothetical protein Q4C13_00990 [Clostridia bacterium]|nr:hypothetical protein [Clostridia bacterium]